MTVSSATPKSSRHTNDHDWENTVADNCKVAIVVRQCFIKFFIYILLNPIVKLYSQTPANLIFLNNLGKNVSKQCENGKNGIYEWEKITMDDTQL